MRSPASSCLKALSCGCATDEKKDFLLQSSPSDTKRRWSFGKKSYRHRILSNFVTSSSVRATNKEVPDAVESKSKSSADEENAPSVEYADGKTHSPADVKLSLPQNVGDGSVADQTESVIITLQTSIRGYLAQKKLHKLRSIVKLQAAVRGHVVRQRAVGTLRCVQAIVKMQSVIRNRYARDVLKEKERPSNVSIENLLSNKFARQLIETAPKKNRINIKCDSSKEDSSWVWFERWTSISASPKQNPITDKAEIVGVAAKEHSNIKSKDVPVAEKATALKEQSNDQSNDQSIDALPTFGTVSLKGPINDCLEDAFASRGTISFEESTNGRMEDALANSGTVSLKEPTNDRMEDGFGTSGTVPLTDPTKDRSEDAFASFSLKEPTNGQLEDAFASSETLSLKEHSMDQSEEKLFASGSEDNLISYDTEHLDSRAAFISEERKNKENHISSQPTGNVIGSRNASNPSFIAAQTLFAGLSSGHVSKVQEPIPVVRLGGSECGTELSITSALDSPDEVKQPIVEAEGVEHAPSPTLISENSEAQRFSSPGSNVTASETPSTQRSSKMKRNGSKMRRKLSNGGRRSSEVPTSGEVSSGDVRRGSEGDRGLRPHFMQATVSAKAKLSANSNSPRSSPDLQENATKRHSIPGASGRQTSPRIHRVMSQPAKLRPPTVVHEKKWQR